MKKESVEMMIKKKIHTIKGKKVIMDFDAAELYGVKLSTLRRAVNQNRNRFPDDCLISLTSKEFCSVKANEGTAIGKKPSSMSYAFTHDGFVMLSNILNSRAAILFHIFMIRALCRAGMIGFANFGIHHTKEEDIPLN